jgi:hypothetical protein
MKIYYQEIHDILTKIFKFKDITNDERIGYFHEKSEAIVLLPPVDNKDIPVSKLNINSITHTLWGYGLIKERTAFFEIVKQQRLIKEQVAI